MLNTDVSMNNRPISGFQLESQIQTELQNLFKHIPKLEERDPKSNPLLKAKRPDGFGDFPIHLEHDGESWLLIVEVKYQAQPQHIRSAILQMREYRQRIENSNVYTVLGSTWLSPQSRELCREAGIGYLDLSGNCYLNFSSIYIDRSGSAPPKAVQRELQSIFKSKSARVLRTLLKGPQAWRVAQLAEVSQVSVGHVSNVRTALLEREWAVTDEAGVRLTNPHALLEEWRTNYRSSAKQRLGFYSLLSGEALAQATQEACVQAENGSHLVLAGLSAARHIAPYARFSSQYFYADARGLEVLGKHLKLEPVGRGENVVVEFEPDQGIFQDRIQVASNVWCTGLAQTYLDLSASGERSLEAAEHLYQSAIAPLWTGQA